MLLCRAWRARREAEAEESNSRMYMLACMISSFVWAKHRPGYDEIFHSEKQQPEMDDAQLFATVRAINAALGGKELGNFDGKEMR